MQTVKEIREYLQRLKESGKTLPGDINPNTAIEAAIMLAFQQLSGSVKPATTECSPSTRAIVRTMADEHPPSIHIMEGGINLANR